MCMRLQKWGNLAFGFRWFEMSGFDMKSNVGDFCGKKGKKYYFSGENSFSINFIAFLCALNSFQIL